jgi:hypothetical protein
MLSPFGTLEFLSDSNISGISLCYNAYACCELWFSNFDFVTVLKALISLLLYHKFTTKLYRFTCQIFFKIKPMHVYSYYLTLNTLLEIKFVASFHEVPEQKD